MVATKKSRIVLAVVLLVEANFSYTLTGEHQALCTVFNLNFEDMISPSQAAWCYREALKMFNFRYIHKILLDLLKLSDL